MEKDVTFAPEFLEYLRNADEYERGKGFGTDPVSLGNMLYAYQQLRAQQREDAKVSLCTHDSFVDCGSVAATGRTVTITNPAEMARILTTANNFEVVTRLDGTVEAAFAFTGLKE